jgi:hypothetical protein
VVLEKPKKWVGDCNGFVGFGRSVACAANKLVAICDSQTAPLSRRKKRGGKKKQKTAPKSVEVSFCLYVKKSPHFVLAISVKFFTSVDGRITYNVFQAGVSFLLVQVMHLSVNTQKITLAWC